MPQLDHVSYFSQFFWVSILFLSFYVVLIKSLLPRVATVLKVRRKLMQATGESSQAIAKDSETSSYDKVLMGGLQETKALLTSTSKSSHEWVSSTTRTMNDKIFAEPQQKYVDAIGNLMGRKFVLYSLLDENKKI